MKSLLRNTLKAAFALFTLTLLIFVTVRLLLRPPKSPDALLQEADRKAWRSAWEEAEPLYQKAEQALSQRHELSKALYARVSQMPAHMGTDNLADRIWTLTQDLALPEAQDPATKLRILMVRGLFETNYDAAAAKSTWESVKTLAASRHEYLLASRALGEQGIAAYVLGDIGTAKKQVGSAWTVAKYAGDQAAQIRYASAYGMGLVDVKRYRESLGPLNEALNVYRQHTDLGYPAEAIATKIEALSSLGNYSQALSLLGDALRYAITHHWLGELYQLYSIRAGIHERQGVWNLARADYEAALSHARTIGYWRGLAEAGGLLARVFEHENQLSQALHTVDEAIQANKQIPDELYLVPRNLAIKADILAKMGRLKASNDLYQKSADLIDSLLQTAPSVNVERTLVSQLSNVYSGYFVSLCNQGQYREAFRVIEKARGRLEAQALQHYERIPSRKPTPQEQHLTHLNLQLLETDDPKQREQLTREIYEAELQINTPSLAGQAVSRPVELSQLQVKLQPSELLLEYVLSEPQSYVLAITNQSVARYPLCGKNQLEDLANQYRSTIRKRQTDTAAARALFNELLSPVPEYKEKPNVIVVPDGSLHLLPFSALMNNGEYVIANHNLSVVASGTVLTLLRSRQTQSPTHRFSYVGVAAWTKIPHAKNRVLQAILNLKLPVLRDVAGPERSELRPLPESQREVESIAKDLPKPGTILLGEDATESRFKELPLSQYSVLHLATHGYADLEYPDRSALVFAPQQQATDDGLLQVREIRQLHLTANLVTLSACNTGLGPVGQTGVTNLVNAFIEAGAQSVVSTLWETEDHATMHLITTFYSYLSHQESKAEALRKAKLEMLNTGLPPYYWAAFELVGDPVGMLTESSIKRELTRN